MLKEAHEMKQRALEIEAQYVAEIGKLEHIRLQYTGLQDAADIIIAQAQTLGIHEEGKYKIKTVSKPKRVLDVDLFRNQFPEQFQLLFEAIGFKKFRPSKKDAESKLKTEEIDSVCSNQGNYRYDVEMVDKE